MGGTCSTHETVHTEFRRWNPQLRDDIKYTGADGGIILNWNFKKKIRCEVIDSSLWLRMQNRGGGFNIVMGISVPYSQELELSRLKDGFPSTMIHKISSYIKATDSCLRMVETWIPTFSFLPYFRPAPLTFINQPQALSAGKGYHIVITKVSC